jgi:hypothetical protein
MDLGRPTGVVVDAVDRHLLTKPVYGLEPASSTSMSLKTSAFASTSSA